jgi:hypothetical protein
MSETNKKYIVFLFLLCIAVTFGSFNPVHDHEAGLQICYDHIEGEVTPCHGTVFHKDSSENNCTHQSHISKKIEECEFCKFTSTRRYQFILTDNSICSILKSYGAPINIETSSVITQLNRCIQDRAPPIS